MDDIVSRVMKEQRKLSKKVQYVAEKPYSVDGKSENVETDDPLTKLLGEYYDEE